MSRLKTIKLPVSANLKLLLVVLAMAIVAGTLWYTQRLVGELKEAEQRTIRFYATMLQTLLGTPQENTPNSEVTSDLVIRTGDILYFPVITTDADGNPLQNPIFKDNTIVGYEWIAKNIDIDTSLPTQEQERIVRQRMNEMAEAYDPLPIYSITERVPDYVEPDTAAGEAGVGDVPDEDSIPQVTDDQAVPVYDTILSNYLYYEDSSAIKELQIIPWIGMVIISMFILIGYLGFSHIKRSEQSNIWVGMAKETAHQLGTPLSSLMGWVELLKMAPEDEEQVLEAASEMERDVDRLNTVTQRFSKIGSAAELKSVDLRDVIDRVVVYFERRLPHLGKTVSLEFERPTEPLNAKINVDLFQWVFENLVRNAADAIERREGWIKFRAYKGSRGWVVIEVSDNGKGIDPKIRKDIFRPGFSTKQRGWGLGLSLAKRIVEEYHGGKLGIKETSAQGTTFSIRLRGEEIGDSR